MRINWTITRNDIDKVKAVIENNHNEFTKKRWERNVEKKNICIDKDTIIHVMLMCLLSSQQRSGPNTPIGRFLIKEPFPVTNTALITATDKDEYVKEILMTNDLTRYINKISQFFVSNYNKLVDTNWKIIEDLVVLEKTDSKQREREIADYLDDFFKGFGPKQSRNFLQALGITKYEIPLDSRIIKWFKAFGFPVTLSTEPLGDKGYYHFILDGIQELCEEADLYPCILDAAIFSSYDNGKWTKENTRF